MYDRQKSKVELLRELEVLRQRCAELEQAETRRLQAENVLQQSEERFTSLFAESPLAILLADQEGYYTDANPAALNQLGIPSLDAIRSFSIFEGPQWTREVRSQLRQGAVMGMRTEIDFDLVRSLGLMEPTRSGRIWVDWVVAPMGTFGYLVQIKDVTDQVLAEHVVQERALLFRQLFRAIPAPTLLWKERDDGRLVLELYNEAALRLSKGKLADYLGVTIEEFYARTPTFPERVKRTFETGETLQAEILYNLQTIDEERWILTTSAKVGEHRVLDSLVDISALKATEAALRQSEENYRRIVQTAQEAIWVTDAQGRLVLTNPAMAEMLGYSHEEMAGRSIVELVAESGQVQLAEGLQNCRDGNGQRIEIQFLGKDGSLLWSLVSLTPVHSNDFSVSGTLGMMIDITERVRAEESLRASLQEKNLLLMEIHHRVKNNLSIISSLLDLQATSTWNEEVQHHLREGQNRILSVARLHEALSQSSDLDQTHVADYFARLISSLNESMGRTDIEVEKIITDTAMSNAQAVHYGLIVNELVTNAVKHAFGNVNGDSRRIRVAFECLEQGYLLQVSDNGQGLPEDFNPQKSASLGVQLVQMLVDQLGGTVSWDTARNGGTTATVLVPATAGGNKDCSD